MFWQHADRGQEMQRLVVPTCFLLLEQSSLILMLVGVICADLRRLVSDQALRILSNAQEVNRILCIQCMC